MDVRIYKAALEENQGIIPKGRPEDILEWAFAGESYSNKKVTDIGIDKPYHAVWDHWIDSKTHEPSADEGDMLLQPNGDVLERGCQIHPVTGLECEYEELWGDLDTEIVGKEIQRVSVALKIENDDRLTRGIVVRVGSWCQGILRTGEDITVERWQSKNPKSGEWNLVRKIGSAALPCKSTLNVDGLEVGAFVQSDGLQWKVVEVFHW